MPSGGHSWRLCHDELSCVYVKYAGKSANGKHCCREHQHVVSPFFGVLAPRDLGRVYIAPGGGVHLGIPSCRLNSQMGLSGIFRTACDDLCSLPQFPFSISEFHLCLCAGLLQHY